MREIDIEEWNSRWTAELRRILIDNGDVYKELEVWQLANPAPKRKHEVKITIPKIG